MTPVPNPSLIQTLVAGDLAQRTLAGDAIVCGTGFVTGAKITLRMRPADADTGLLFIRTDLPERPHVAACIENVVPRRLRTTIESGSAKVEMTEHVLAAFAGLGIYNGILEIDGPEAPGMDGSAQAFTEAILKAGVLTLGAPANVYKVTEPITVAEKDAQITILPTQAPGLTVDYTLDYGASLALGRQEVSFPIRPDVFARELAAARTFILERDIEALRSQGLGQGISYRDLLVLSDAGTPIDNELRFPDECARHKALDIVGDLALFGMPIQGHVRAEKSGHWLNAALVRGLKEQRARRAQGGARAA